MDNTPINQHLKNMSIKPQMLMFPFEAESIAFCCLSTGVFRFPQQRAAEIAVRTVKDYLDKDQIIKQVIFNVFKNEDLEIYNSILGI